MPKRKKSFHLPRLRKRAEFLKAAKGARAPGPAFILQFTGRAASKMPRYGLTATKKLGGAVIRNRARRRLRAVAEKVLPKAKAGDYVLVARPGAVTRNFRAMHRDLEKALKKLSCLEDRILASPVKGGAKQSKEKPPRKS